MVRRVGQIQACFRGTLFKWTTHVPPAKLLLNRWAWMPDAEGMGFTLSCPKHWGNKPRASQHPLSPTTTYYCQLPVPSQASTGLPQLDLSLQTVYTLFPWCHLAAEAAIQTPSTAPLLHCRDRYFPAAFSPLPLIILSAKAFIQMCGNGETAGALQRAIARQLSPQGQTDPGKRMLENLKISLWK